MRFLVFAFRDYYASGGFEDLVLVTNEVSDIIKCLSSSQIKDEYQNYQVVDLLAKKIVSKTWGYGDELEIFKESDWKSLGEFAKSNDTDYGGWRL